MCRSFSSSCTLIVASALGTLYLLGALDDTKSLTPLGRTMAHFPLEPPYARALVSSFEYGCPSEVLSILSILSASSKIFIDTTDTRESAAESRRKFRALSGDHVTLLNIFKSFEEVRRNEAKAKGERKEKEWFKVQYLREWCRAQYLSERCLSEAWDIREQLRGVCERLNMDWKISAGAGEGNDEPVLKSLLAGLVNQAAFLQADGSYKQIMGPSVSCPLFFLHVWPDVWLLHRSLKSILHLRSLTGKCLPSYTTSSSIPPTFTPEAYQRSRGAQYKSWLYLTAARRNSCSW